MQTTKKMILGLGTVVLLATAAVAYQGGERGSCDMKNKQHKMMKMKHHQKGGGIMGTIMRLDLTPEQREQIGKIFQEMRDSKQSPSQAFTAKDFDKEMFVKLMKEKREARIERKAQTIDKIYALLNEVQKKNLKLMLDNKMQKGQGCNDKNCNGRG